MPSTERAELMPELTTSDILSIWDSINESEQWKSANERDKAVAFARAILSARSATL